MQSIEFYILSDEVLCTGLCEPKSTGYWIKNHVIRKISIYFQKLSIEKWNKDFGIFFSVPNFLKECTKKYRNLNEMERERSFLKKL